MYNYEKAVHAHNHGFFWKGLCFNYLVSTLFISLRLSFLKVIYSGWIDNPPPPPPPTSTFILEQELIQYYYNLIIQFCTNLYKIIPSQEIADIIYYLIDTDIITFFLASKGKKI